LCLLKVSLLTPTKLEPFREWPEPKTLTEARSFHGLATYRRFIRHFSFIMAPIIDSLKKDPFQWTHKAASAFNEIKEMMSSAQSLGILTLVRFLRLLAMPLDMPLVEC